MQSYTLNNGAQMPKLGLGTFLSKDPESLIKVIKEAYKVGYRHFDTAQLYGNEESLGKAFQELFKEGVKREEIFVTTKTFIFKGESVVEKLKESLKKLAVDYVDLYLIHWPFVGPRIENNEIVLQHMPVHQGWEQMEKCVELKLAKSIGVSNFNVQSLIDLLSYCKIKPVANQVELHPYLTQEGLLDCCKRFHIHVTAYSPLARKDSTELYGNQIDLFKDPILLKMSEKYKKTPAQICLRFLLEKEVSVIPKTEKVERVKENFDVFWEGGISSEDMNELNQLNKGMRTVSPKLIESWQHLDAFA